MLEEINCLFLITELVEATTVLAQCSKTTVFVAMNELDLFPFRLFFSRLTCITKPSIALQHME